VDSIAANIVEGCGAATRREFARFLDIAIKSANATEFHLLSARDRNLVSPDMWQTHTAETIEIRKMLFAYRVLARVRPSRRLMTLLPLPQQSWSLMPALSLEHHLIV
jgi:hypothetical protein